MAKLVKDIPKPQRGRGGVPNPENEKAKRLADKHPGQWVQVERENIDPKNGRWSFLSVGYEASIRMGKLFIRRPA